MDDYLDLLGLDELREFCKKRKISLQGRTKREQLVEAIKCNPLHRQQTLCFGKGSLGVGRSLGSLEALKETCGPIIRLFDRVAETLPRLTDLFFAASSDPQSDNLATAILSDLNRRSYPVYEIARSGPLFESRAHWLQWEGAQHLYGALWKRLEASEEDVECLTIDHYVSDVLVRWTSELMRPCYAQRPYFLRRTSSAWVLTKCLSLLADAYEKTREYDKAVAVYESLLEQDLFCLGRRGQWYERLAVILQRHLKRPDEALQVCTRGLADEWVRTGSRLALRRRKAKLEKNAEGWEEFPIEELVINGELATSGSTGRKLVFRLDEDSVGSVEDLVLHHFAQEENGNWQGLHTESSVYTTLFSLLFWDILFGPVPDVFQSPYQAAPLDFHTDSFYLARREAIDGRLAAIAQEEYWKEALVNTWNSQHGRICVGVSWEYYDLDQLWSVMRAVGGPALSVLFRSLAEDQKHSRSGMPDLILWRQVGERMEHLLVEVKSARDRLSDAQRHWAWIFHHAGVRMLVCKVKHP